VTLVDELDRYLSVRRSLGYDLSTSARILGNFLAFMDKNGDERITSSVFLEWQRDFGHAGRDTWAARYSAVRLFSQWLSGLGQHHEALPPGLIPNRARRVRPHIYSADEIANIVMVAADLPSTYGVRGLTCSTLFGLIAATGLRISEALGLDVDDVDLENGVLTIRQGKLGKARLVPLHASVKDRLRLYMLERDRLLGRPSQPLFVTCRGERMGDCGARYNFAQVCQHIGLRTPQLYGRHGRGPRIHDLRHSFAVRTLIQWYQAGADPNREMVKLTTYLGHVKPEHTYWYIEAVPELLQLASDRLAQESRP